MFFLLDVWGKQPAQEISNPERYPVRGVAFSPDGSFLVTSALDQVVFWNAKTLKESERLPGPYPTDLAFSPDGSKLAATGYSGVTIWDVAASNKNPIVVEKWPEPSDDALANPFRGNPLAFTPDNQVLVYAACKQVDLPLCGESEIRRWNLALGNWSEPIKGPNNFIQHLDVSGDGSMVVGTYCKQYTGSACGVSRISLWDLATGEELHSFEQPGFVNGAIFAAESKTLVIVKERELVFVDISWVK